jgi:hypothetical protein
MLHQPTHPQFHASGSVNGGADVSAEETAQKQRGRPFQPGQSGNPRGRPPGSRNRVLLALDQIGEDAAADVLRAAIERAKAGDLR